MKVHGEYTVYVQEKGYIRTKHKSTVLTACLHVRWLCHIKTMSESFATIVQSFCNSNLGNMTTVTMLLLLKDVTDLKKVVVRATGTLYTKP